MVKRALARTDPGAWTQQALEELEILEDAHHRYAEVLDVFTTDLAVYKDKEFEASGEALFWGRTLVRSQFAGIEGLCYRLKHMALAAAALRNVDLTRAECAMLREESYVLKEKGYTKITKSKLRTADNVAFTLRVLAKARGGTYKLDVNSLGWRAFKASILVRDRVTHPKGASDLEVTKEEVESTLAAATWFLREASTIMLSTPIPSAIGTPSG